MSRNSGATSDSSDSENRNSLSYDRRAYIEEFNVIDQRTRAAQTSVKECAHVFFATQNDASEYRATAHEITMHSLTQFAQRLRIKSHGQRE